jgi:endonuclease/exonuclease/phosphatase family metal-dependent hydrolase
MHKFDFSVWLLVFFFSSASLCEATGMREGVTGESFSRQDFHLMSFNIKGLPTFILSSDYKDSRYAMIGKLLAGRVIKGDAPDVVLLQEAFTDLTASLIEASGYPHKAEGPGAGSYLGVNSGLYILSRHPILESDSRAFGSKDCLSWDCMANKGVQFARIAVPGLPQPVEIYNTHLQAGREDTVARQSQVKTLLAFFKEKHRAGSPVFFSGDFNFRPGLGQKSFLEFAKGTGFTHAGKYCLEKGCAKSGDVGWHGIWERAVDHQFFANGEGLEIFPFSVERTYRDLVEGQRLSDHPAHEVKYEIRWKESRLAKDEAPVPPAAPKP